jgi:hypothetical protein
MKIAYVLKTLPKLAEMSRGRQKGMEGFSLHQSTKKCATLLADGSPLHQIRIVPMGGVTVMEREWRRRKS